MHILVVDIGGTNVKMLASGQEVPRKFPSGRELTPQKMVDGVLAATQDWDYEAVAIGFPGPLLCGQPMTEPVNLGPGWMGFDFAGAFRRPVKVINDAAMQALGSYQGGKMLFVGLGTGFGATVIMDGSHGTAGAWPVPLQETHAAAVRREPGAEAAGTKEMAAPC